MVACCSTPAQAASTLALCSATNVAGLPGALESGVAGEPVDSDPSLLLTDGIHPNATGQQKLFDVVVAANIPAAL